MLQPRLTGCGGEMGYRNRMLPKWSLVVCAAVLLSTTLVTCQDVNDDELIESSRIKREGVPDNRDLTVLLVNEKRNDYNTKIGRYHSVKPLIGLLTSTARTFIQDGVTTEFATQILGTTLDNGRIYAQLLTKSSLVLYNKPSNVDDPIIVRPTRVHSVFDGGWNVKQDLGFIDPEKFVLKNTDYLAPSSKMNIVYASKPVQDNIKYWSLPSAPDNQVENQIFDEPIARRVQPVKEIPRYVQNEAFNYLDGPIIEAEKKYEFYVEPSNVGNVHVPHRQSKAYEPVTEPFITEKLVETLTEEPNVVKVKPDYDLPTFTIKNEFSPIFYYIDNVESRKPLQPAVQQTKLPKKLFGQKSEPRPKTTFTYEGFADFTTIVGDTVIIFTPNTETIRPPNPDEVNVYPSAKRVETLATKITFLSADIPVATSTYKAHESISPTKVGTPSSVEENTSEQPIYNDEESLKKLMYEVNDKDLSPVNIQQNSEFGLNVDVIQPSESTITTTESTRITDNLGVIPIQDSSSQPTEPLIPSSTSTEITKESAVTESNMSELFTNSEEESDNTAAEVTEKNEEEEIEEEEEEKPTEIITTTESGHSDESSEEIESTTESKIFTTEHDDDEDDDSSENINKDGNNSDNTNNNNFRNDNVYHDDSDSDNFENDGIEHETHEDVFCTDGLETQSTMTTAYKTLTYLTTYFIPLESTETTTSVKSDVVVESNVGYYTNVVCRTSFDIEPTAVISVDVNYSVQTNIEVPQSAQEETTEMPIIESEPSTENPKTTESYKTTIEDNETLTTVQEENAEDNKQTTVGVNVDNESKESVELQEPTTSLTTTTEAATTSQGHVEVSVSTEHTTTTTSTEKPVAIEENIEDEENEIDVIYKTLYTTYTYFTTFFGDQTSSVASHKSVVTNVITSTIDLSNLDPSLLGAFEESEIAPTKVGIDGSTESVAINSIIDLVKNKDVIESVEVDDIYSSQTPTPALGDDLIASIKPDAVKTYYTTYTFFTTIFVGSDANVCSRSEIYTNYVGPDELIPTKSNPLTVESTRAQFDFRNCKQVKVEPNVEENSSMETSVTIEQQNINDYNKDQVQPSPIEVDMLFSVESNPLESENSYVTDVKSSSSKGDRKFLDSNYILDDQISSESNIDEIMPSPTLLLQTSYTTFTYFTTMYIGKDSSKVKSHLETITNVVTETITPNKEAEDESSLPITYYTTFTYWTTLYKDKTTTITSREEIVSNVVTPSIQSVPTISPIDTKPIEVDSLLPPKELEAEIKPSLLYDKPEQDDGKATYFTTYTYFTTFYAGNTSQVRSSLETVTNIVENTKNIEDNQIARKVPEGSPDKNLIQDNGEKPLINPTVIKEVIETTKVPDIASASPTVLLGTYIDNLFAEVKPISPPPEGEKKILFSQVAVISGDSTIVTSDNKTLNTNANATTSTTTTTENAIISSSPDIIESSFTETETTTESKLEEEDDGTSTRKKSRLTFKPKKPSITPVITPFLSRNRPTFIPKRVPLSNSATTITRLDVTPTITATPTLKSVRQSGFAGNRKQPAAQPAVSSTGKRFSGRSSVGNLSANTPSASRPGGFGRASVQPTSRRGGFRSSSLRSNSLDYISRSATARLIRPTASLRLPPGRSSRQFASITFPPQDQNEETFGTQQDETVTESLDEFNESPIRTTTNNPLLKFRRPPITRQPGTAITPRSTTQSARRGGIITRGRTTTTTKRSTSRATTNPLLLLRRERPNSLFPRRNLFKQPDPEPEEEIIKEDEQNGEDDEELLEEEDFEVDNDYGSSDRKERQVSNPTTQFPKKTNVVQIRPFAFKRRTKRQADYSNRKYTNFRRPGLKTASTRRPEPEPETEAPHTQKPRPGGRFNSRIAGNSRSTTSSAPKAPARQSFIVRGESRTTTTTTTSAPAYRRGKSRAPSRTTTSASRPKAPRLSGKSSTARSSTSRSTARSRTRTTTSRASSKQRNSFENLSAERFNYNNILNDGKITVTHQIPTEVTVPIVNGKITEYKNLLSATQSIETLLLNQVSSSIGPLGNPQLVLAAESTELAENGATKIIKFLLHETPTTTVVFTPTTIRGRKTSFSHILPSTVYNVEAVTQTVAPEINNNVPLANLLLSQLLLGNQQPAINPLLAFQGQGLLPQQPIVQTPVTEYKTRTTTYVTTVTDARETVLPITFKGRAILTTIVDPTTNVITATEYVTDTVVTTPTALAPAPQLNSLLLPLLLQQQQQQQQALSLQTVNPLLQLGTHDLNINSLNNLSPLQNNLNNDIYSNSPKPNILSDLNSNEDFSEDEPENIEEDEPPPPPPTRSRTRHRAPKPPPAPPSPPKLTSIVTLYVSGKHPGEFSTVLSTVVSDDTQTVRKREAIYYEDVKVSPSVLPTVTELYGSHSDNTLAVSETERYLDTSIDNQIETQSLESIVGEISKHIRYETSPTYVFDLGSPSSIRHIKQSSVDDISSFNTHSIIFDNTPWRPGSHEGGIERALSEDDERKIKNVATRIMSNGVEVLVRDKNADGKQEQTKYMEVKTIQPTSPTGIFMSNYQKADKRTDKEEDSSSFDIIQPSEVSHIPCTTSCSCSHSKTDSLKTNYGNIDATKTTNYGTTVLDLRPTNKETLEKKTNYGPYEFEGSTQLAPTDKIVEKYTQVINDYSDEKESNAIVESELLTNEQAPTPSKTTKVNNKTPEKNKPEKIQKPNKNKFVVADLLKLGTLGIKSLTQLAPVIEKMTGGFIKRQEAAAKTTTTTLKPVEKLTAYNVNNRIDSNLETKHNNFPIYIPVDELETSESQFIFTNATLHQSLAWAAEHKQSKSPPKVIHESPLVNGGIPISPGEIITTNSDVIVGKPAVGGPFTLVASGIKLQNPVNPPAIDSMVSANEHFLLNEKPLNDQFFDNSKVDDSFDLRPPNLPSMKTKPILPNIINQQRPTITNYNYQNKIPYRKPSTLQTPVDHWVKTDSMKSSNTVLSNHGRPVFLDYIPSLVKPTSNNKTPLKHHVELKPTNNPHSDIEIADNSPSSSEIVNTQIKTDDEYTITESAELNKPFLVDIQPSRVANVLIPHGSSTAIVFAGSSEPHKTGDYVDDPLPYPEPGYFGSFSIDAPQMTNVHNVAPNNKNVFNKPNIKIPRESYSPDISSYKLEQPSTDDHNSKWKEYNRHTESNKIPSPTSNQETHVQVGPQITAYNPEVFSPTNSEYDKYSKDKDNTNDDKKVIDKEYENYLAVPPPPPKMLFNPDSPYDQSKPYSQRPIVHTKPVQDMKVFLNIQHPVPKEKTPQKVTSEIYFAAQAPNNKVTPTYTFHIPSPPLASTHNKYLSNNIQSPHSTATNVGNTYGHYSISSSPNNVNNSLMAHGINDKSKIYAVTLNTATNVAGNIGEGGQIIGSSVQIPINSSLNMGLNTDIPIPTNFAIKVDDSIEPFETYNLQGSKTPIIYDEHGRVPIEVSVGDNRWNKSTSDKVETTIVGHNYYNEFVEKPIFNNPLTPSSPSSTNSHANFPMTNEDTKSKDVIIEYTSDVKTNEQKRPAKLIPNIPTNSNGWYSSVLNENNINNIKHVESTTRKNIPLLHEYNEKDHLPNFGHKIESAGKPPSDFWSQHPQRVTGFNIGKPFTKPISTEKPFSSIRPFTIKPYNHDYIPSNIGVTKPPPAYIIPIRDNNNKITTVKAIRHSTQRPKPVYENSEEIYDGEEESDSTYDNDGEVSLESMKVPVVTTSNEINGSTSSELTLLQEEVLNSDKTNKGVFISGIQTEKPFGMFGVLNKTIYHTSTTKKPIYENNSYNMKPRPFTINTAAVLDHQLQQPHWQINQMMENDTNASYEDNIELNTGEEFNKPIISSSTISPSHHKQLTSKPNLPPEPVLTRLNSTHVVNDSNIITSTVHIKDKKPLIVEKDTEKPTLTTLEISTDVEINQTSSEIIDLSPPPPTLDNNFKSSTNNEMIMGMSPPPPRISSNVRPPIRISHTPRPIPVRNPPLYRPKPQRTLPPRYQTQKPLRKQTIKDDISTYRPVNKDEISGYKPLKKEELSTFKPNSKDNVSTYRPAYNILNNIRRPTFNRDQPSSQLLPPPRDLPSKVISFNDIPSPTIKPPSIPKIVFPTPISSGWLTSSDIDYYSSFNFAPSSIRFPESHPSELSVIGSMPDVSSENSYSYEVEYSSELSSEISSEKPLTGNSKENEDKESTQNIALSNEANFSDSNGYDSSENISTNKMVLSTLNNKNRTRKPYPVRHNDMKPNTSKFKMPPKATVIIAPTRTLSRPETLSPTRHVSIKKIVRPVNTRVPDIIEGTIIESSEIYGVEDFIKPTQVLNVESTSEIILSSGTENLSNIIIKPTIKEIQPIIQSTHHAGNEVKISDEIIPTKTEFRTTVVTHTKTLSEPPKTVSSIGFVNLTHTLTVTHTQTSLISQSEGAVTETLILTNTQTSTIVDVVTEIHTQVQPTTIIETVTKHVPVPTVEPTPVLQTPSKTKAPLDDITMSSEESDNFIIKDNKGSENVQKIDNEADTDNDSFFVVLNKSQNGGHPPTVNTEVETGDFDGITRNEQVNNNGVSQVLFGEILLAGAPYLETTNVGTASTVTYGKECQPDCKASRNERCQRIDSIMKCVCRPGFARMFPDRPCKPTYTYSVKLALGTQGNESLKFHKNLLDNSSKEYQSLAGATHEGINRMVMQSDLRDVYHGVHINGFHPVEMKTAGGDSYQGVINDFYVQLSDNAHESRLKEVIEKYLRNNNYSLGGTDVLAAGEFMDQLDVSDFDECTSGHFHDCSEHAQCFNLRGTYTCSCLEGYADLSVNNLYPGRICSAEPVGCEKCNYHGTCYSRDDRRMLCECFQWYTGSTCQINLKVVLISLVVLGALLTLVLTACAVLACRRTRPPQRSIVACIQSMPTLHQGAMPSKQRADRRALISERGDTGDASSVQNASLPYIPAKRPSSTKKIIMSDPPAHDPPPPPPAPAVMIPRARLHPHHEDSRENLARKRSLELSSEAKLISYLESGATVSNNEMRRKHSLESSYSANKDRHNKQGALVSAGFKVSTTVRADESAMKEDRDDLSSVNKADLEADLARFDSLRKAYSHEDLSEWTDAERRLGELTLSEARSIGGTLPASTGRAASSTRLTHQEANTMAERDLGSTFLLPHVHLYKPDLTSDVSEFDSL